VGEESSKKAGWVFKGKGQDGRRLKKSGAGGSPRNRERRGRHSVCITRGWESTIEAKFRKGGGATIVR